MSIAARSSNTETHPSLWALVDSLSRSMTPSDPLFPPHQPPPTTCGNLPPLIDPPPRDTRLRLRQSQSVSVQSARERRP
jgi:hypothetical protein